MDCEFSQVIVVPPSNKAKKNIVSYPYDGPPLYWLKTKAYIYLNESESDTPLLIDCSVCGQKRYKFRRINLKIDKVSWDGQHIFKLKQFQKSSATYITQELLSELVRQDFTNFGFIEAGKIE